jgi:hypothetical protein
MQCEVYSTTNTCCLSSAHPVVRGICCQHLSIYVRSGVCWHQQYVSCAVFPTLIVSVCMFLGRFQGYFQEGLSNDDVSAEQEQEQESAG